MHPNDLPSSDRTRLASQLQDVDGKVATDILNLRDQSIINCIVRDVFLFTGHGKLG